MKSSSRCSLVHILSTSSSKSGPRPSVFYDFCVKSSSRYSVVHIFCRPHLKKVVRARQFLAIFIWNGALATVACAFYRPLSGSRRTTAENGQPLYLKKKNRVLRPRVFSAVNSRVRSGSHFPTTWWWCDWDDDVVDMMVRQLAARIVRNSEVS